jgi:hypothetical protein
MELNFSILGTLLRLIGISSPEDTRPEDTRTESPKNTNSTPHPPSWRDNPPSSLGDSQNKPPSA